MSENTPPPERPSGPIKIPEGLWVKCKACKEIIYSKEVARGGKICPKCGYHFPLTARERLDMLCDAGKWTAFGNEIKSADPLKFSYSKKDVEKSQEKGKDVFKSVNYKDAVKKLNEVLGGFDAILCAEGTIEGIPAILCSMDFRFIGGSMGSAVGEKITRAAERALAEGKPLVVISCSGGARMQEGILSLMQMAKISAAVARLREAGLPFISILADPTTGGVTASYAMQGDVNIAEPKALIGFAGQRVIEQTIRQKLPEGFQSAEFVLEKGMVDLVLPRNQLKAAVGNLLRLLHVG
jgi:acetyl-CoA carboxylase carboxyl transferase subunit beta